MPMIDSPYNLTVIGRCSICDGNVVTENLWGSVVPAKCYCTCCGAERASLKSTNAQLPIIPMTHKQSSWMRISDRTTPL